MRPTELQGLLFGEDKYGAHDAPIKCGLRNALGLPEPVPVQHWSWIEDTAWKASMLARVKRGRRTGGHTRTPRMTPELRKALADF